MDVCLPADFLLADEESPLRLRYVDEGPASYEDGYWLGADAFVALPPASAAPVTPAAASGRRSGADPTWQVI